MARRVWRGRLGQQAGFTLLEAMVALAIVALALIPLLRLHVLSLDATLHAQDLTTAVLLAQEALAQLPPFPDAGEEQGAYDQPEYERFRWQAVITEDEAVLDTIPQPIQVRRIEVTVVWLDGRRERHYTLEAFAVQ